MTASVVVLTATAFLVVIVLLVRRVGGDTAPALDAALRSADPPVPKEPASLTSARWLVANASTAGGLHFRVRPVLVELTDARLRRQHGLDLAHPGAGAVVGEDLWAIVRPDALAPDDRMAPGISLATLAAALDRLERL